MNNGAGQGMRWLLGGLIITVAIASFAQCKKDDEPPTKKVEIPEEKVVDKTYFPENTQSQLDDLHERTVRYFWDTGSGGGAEEGSGMIGEGADRKGMLATGDDGKPLPEYMK